MDSGPGGVRVLQHDMVHSRSILAEVSVQASVDQVWRVLTDYDKLADFVPNLLACERMSCPNSGRIRLRQRGCSQSVFLRLEAQAVLELQEVHKPMNRRELRFVAVEGDFEEYSGKWTVEADPMASLSTLLRYEITIVPKLSIPSALVSCIVKAGLPANIMALAKRAEQLSEERRKFPRFSTGALQELGSDKLPFVMQVSSQNVEQLPAKGPVRETWQSVDPGATHSGSERQYLGVTSVPVPPNYELRKASTHAPAEAATQAPTEPVEGAQGARSAPLGADWRQISGDAAHVDLQMRNLDDADSLHRRVVATLYVDAPLDQVWKTLTAYERLPEFLPNLLLCERLQPPEHTGNSSRMKRIRQVGYKNMMYMCLHAEAIMDLMEIPDSNQIQFKQVQGDFHRLQGKWILQSVEQQEGKEAQTCLKYAVEVQLLRSTRITSVLEPLLERVVYSDLTANLNALKAHVEEAAVHRQVQELQAAGRDKKAAAVQRNFERPSPGMLNSDPAVLEAELVRTFGATTVLPTRAQLREANRTDLEKAMKNLGGSIKVAKLIGWQLSYKVKKPRGWWDRATNVQAEMDEFIEDHGLPERVLPSKNTFIKAGRYDLAKAVERWGGVFELASALKYEVPQGRVRGVLSRSLTTKIKRDSLHAAKASKASDQISLSEDLASRSKAKSHPSSNSSSGVQRRPAQSDQSGVKSKQQFSKSLRREIDAW